MKINYINNYYLPSRPVSAVQSTRYNRGRGLGGRGVGVQGRGGPLNRTQFQKRPNFPPFF